MVAYLQVSFDACGVVEKEAVERARQHFGAEMQKLNEEIDGLKAEIAKVKNLNKSARS
jgi:hypothetical protein